MTTDTTSGGPAPRGIDPISILALLCLVVVGLSIIGDAAGWSAPNLATGSTVEVLSIFSAENVRRLLADMPETFFGFAPLGMVVLILLGSGFAERVGLIGAALDVALRNVPAWALTPAIAVIGILAHIGTDAAYFVVIPFAGYAFAAAGRSPLAGVCAAFAAVGGGYAANLLVTPTDVVVYALTETAARVLDPSITIDILANYFLLAAYAGVVVVVVTVLTDHVLEPHLKTLSEAESPTAPEPKAVQHRGLALSVLVMAAVIAGGAALGLAPNGPLRDETGALKPFYKSFVAIVAIALFSGALTFGITNGRLKRDTDVYDQMRGALADTAPFMLLVFFAAHFAAFLDWSNLAVISAAAGAAWLKTIDLGGPALVIAFCLLTSALNLVLPSTSAKWALMAPAAVPMMMSLGISPEMTAAAYRLGASATELVTPTAMTPIVLLFAQRYAPRMGLGRFMAIMTPYMLGLLTAALALLWVWTAFDLPLGPTGARMSYTPPG